MAERRNEDQAEEFVYRGQSSDGTEEFRGRWKVAGSPPVMPDMKGGPIVSQSLGPSKPSSSTEGDGDKSADR